MKDIGPLEALMLLCSYENHMGEVIDLLKLEHGKVKLENLLTEENFAMVHKVSTSLHPGLIPLIPYLCLYLYPKLDQCVSPNFFTNTFPHSAAAICFLPTKMNWWNPLIPRFSVVILCAH